MSDNETGMHSEGDLNTSTQRAQWDHRDISAKTRSLLEEDAKYFLHQSLSTPCLNVMNNSKGAFFEDADGNRYLDFHGNYIHNLGFGHPAVIQAITEQLQTLSFCTRRYTNEPAINLARKLTSYSPSLTRTLFAPGGAEAIGMALKIARMATGRHKTISLWDSFHGATLDASSIGGEAMFRKDIGPLLTGTEHAPPPNPSECPFNCGKTCSLQCAGYIEYMLEKEGDVAAVVAETIRSSPFIPPADYWKKIRAACDKHGALLILDEIPHALGRTGKMFTFQHYGIEPDMVVIGKGLGGEVFPLAAVIAKEHFNEVVKQRAIGHYTHEKNPVAAAAALAMLNHIEENNLLDHVQEMGAYALQQIHSLKQEFEMIYDVRGLGLILGIELRDPATGEKALDIAEAVMYQSLQLGLNFKLSMGNIINLTPPMNVTKQELDQAFSIIKKALKKCS